MAKRRTFRVAGVFKHAGPLMWIQKPSEAKAYELVGSLLDFHGGSNHLSGVTGVRVEVREAGSDRWEHYETLEVPRG